MREIKFRIWSKKTGKFISPVLPQKFHLLPNLYDVQQFTGLTDRLGVEIYEGDILTDTSLSEPHVIIVDFSDDYYGFYPMCSREFDNKSLEVIGNIYENPELIK